MADVETVFIEAQGGRYEVRRAERVLLRVPAAVFERYEAEAVFPPLWLARADSHPVRRLFWNPQTAEFVMTGLEAHPVRSLEGVGTTAYRSYLQGVWVPRPPVLLLRPYWNPDDPDEPFDRAARARSYGAQRAFLGILEVLRPPPGWGVVLNATSPYLEALGVSPGGPAPEADGVLEVSVIPPASPGGPAEERALEALALEHVGSLFPVLRAGRLVGVHALCAPALHTAQALLDTLGIPYQEGPYRPH